MTHPYRFSQGIVARDALDSYKTEAGAIAVGEGSTAVVFVPTFHEIAFVYSPILMSLPSQYTGYTYVPRTDAKHPFGPEERAHELAAFLEKNNISQAHFVSWSDSAPVLSRFASMHADKVLSRCYMQSPARYTLPGPLHVLGRVFANTGIYRVTPKWVAVRIVAKLLGGGKIAPREFYDELHNMRGFTGLLKYSILPCILHEEHHPELPTPTLVLGGDNDWWIDSSSIAQLASVMHATYREIRGGDHFLPWTSQDEVTSIVINHLESWRENNE